VHWTMVIGLWQLYALCALAWLSGTLFGVAAPWRALGWARGRTLSSEGSSPGRKRRRGSYRSYGSYPRAARPIVDYLTRMRPALVAMGVAAVLAYAGDLGFFWLQHSHHGS
jgi:hypothetical protein